MHAISPEKKSHNELYRKLILDHAKCPKNFGKQPNNSHYAEGINSLCGDKIRIYALVNKNNIIDQLSFEGTGCAISIASSSIMTTLLLKQDINYAEHFAKNLIMTLNNKAEDTNEFNNFSQIEALKGVREFPSRIKCATLGWQSFISAINNINITTTEK